MEEDKELYPNLVKWVKGDRHIQLLQVCLSKEKFDEAVKDVRKLIDNYPDLIGEYTITYDEITIAKNDLPPTCRIVLSNIKIKKPDPFDGRRQDSLS